MNVISQKIPGERFGTFQTMRLVLLGAPRRDPEVSADNARPRYF